MGKSLLSELMIRITAADDPSLEQEMGKVNSIVEGVSGKFLEFSRSARESIRMITQDTEGLTSRIEGLARALGVTTGSTNSRGSLMDTSEKDAGSKGKNYLATGSAGNPQVYINSINVNVDGTKRGASPAGVQATMTQEGLSITLPAGLMRIQRSEVASLGRENE